MKKLLMILFLIYTKSLFGQNTDSISVVKEKFNLKNALIVSAPLFMAGISEGTAETLKWHYANGFQASFPDANPSTWNPELSWVLKYKNRDINQGPAFFGSTGPFVCVTDPYHGIRTSRDLFFCAAIILKVGNGKKQKWYRYLEETGIYSVAYSAGFTTSYNLVFGSKY